MSVVWRAYDEVLGRQVAVKLLAGEFAAAPGFRDRIRREAQAVARLSHPAITQVFDYGETPGADGVGVPFVVMELIDGESVAQLLSRGPLPWRSALDIAAQVADALAAAHARGLVHRDVTPGNVMVTSSGVKVVDFGISAVEGELEGTHLLGTPAYLSPERLAGAPAQPATDIYCLGVLTCQLLTGHPPVDGRLPTAVAGLPAEVPALLAACLAMEPAQRPDAATLAGRLRAALGRASAHVAAPPGSATRRLPNPAPRSGTRVLAGPPPLLVIPAGPPPRPPRTRRWTWLVGALAVLAVLTFACGALFAKGNPSGGTAQNGVGQSPKSPPPPPSPTVKCAAEFKITTDWKIGFIASLTVLIQGNDDVTGWRVEFDFAGNQKIDSGFPGKYTQAERHVTIKNDNWNAVLEAGKSYTTGILAHYTGANDKPTKISLNGVACANGTG